MVSEYWKRNVVSETWLKIFERVLKGPMNIDFYI